MPLEHDVVIFFLCSGAMGFTIYKRESVLSLPYAGILVGGFVSFFLSLLFAILSHIVLHNFTVILEHLFFNLGSVLFLIWCGYMAWRPGKASSKDQ